MTSHQLDVVGAWKMKIFCLHGWNLYLLLTNCWIWFRVLVKTVAYQCVYAEKLVICNTASILSRHNLDTHALSFSLFSLYCRSQFMYWMYGSFLSHCRSLRARWRLRLIAKCEKQKMYSVVFRVTFFTSCALFFTFHFLQHFAPGSAFARKVKDFAVYFLGALIKTKFAWNMKSV